MNDILMSLHNRKSVRSYEERPIELAEKQAILDAAVQAPTAGNMSLFTILDITDLELKQKLSVTCDNQPFIAKAPLVLIFCADYRRWYDAFCDGCDKVRKPDVGDFMLATADALIAAQNAVVAAESLGIGSCYIGDITENYEIHKELLNLPRYVAPAAMLCFGYPTKQQRDRAKPIRFSAEDLVYENGYQADRASEMGKMLKGRERKSDEEYADWIQRFCARKWNSDFSVEMSRSCRAMLADWCEEKIL